MTNEAALPVEQSDREEFAKLLDIQGGPNTMPSYVRMGQADDHPGVQAFARHRIAALSQPAQPSDTTGEADDVVERMAGASLESLAGWLEYRACGGVDATPAFCEGAANIIRAALAAGQGGQG